MKLNSLTQHRARVVAGSGGYLVLEENLSRFPCEELEPALRVVDAGDTKGRGHKFEPHPKQIAQR